MAYYGLLYRLFDTHLWRKRLLRNFGLVRVPDFRGCWRGYLISSFDSHAKRHNLILTVFQSWTHITVFLTTTTSLSRSTTAMIQTGDPDGAALVYQYQNQPLADAMKTMHMHFGTARLKLSENGGLEGDYYAGRDRRTFGRICCRREYDCAGSGSWPHPREPGWQQPSAAHVRELAGQPVAMRTKTLPLRRGLSF
jgi:hypothetical protein